MDDRRYEELNGCYAMLCEALRAWHRMQKDHPRETAAKVLKDVYGYEFHLNGGGCPWRLPSVDHEWATNGMRALGLPADRFEDNAIVLARLLDGQSGDYELASGRMPETPDTAYGSDADRFVVVEQFHNAFRRITTDWDSVLNRNHGFEPGTAAAIGRAYGADRTRGRQPGPAPHARSVPEDAQGGEPPHESHRRRTRRSGTRLRCSPITASRSVVRSPQNRRSNCNSSTIRKDFPDGGQET